MVRLEGCAAVVGRTCICGTESAPANTRLVEFSESYALDANRGSIVRTETIVREQFIGQRCVIPVRGHVYNGNVTLAFDYRP
jgi:hypothetical protein